MQKKIFLFILFLMSMVSAFSQKEVSGKIVDSITKEPIIGASVFVKGASTGTVTDIDGNFKIKLREDNLQLEVSFIGYISQVIIVEEKTTFYIELIKFENIQLKNLQVYLKSHNPNLNLFLLSGFLQVPQLILG